MLLLVVIVVCGLFVAADRVALSIAEDKAASSLQTSQHLSNKPDVSVAGFPFLTQLVAGRFDEITVAASGVQVGNQRTLRIAGVTVHLHHVTVPKNYASIRADTAVAEARIDYGDLSDTLGFTVRDGGNGRLVTTPSVTIAGQRFSGTVSAIVHASSGGGITFADVTVSAAGLAVPGPVDQALGAVFDTGVSLAGLPFRVRVDGVDVTSAGLVLRLSGRDLVYSRN